MQQQRNQFDVLHGFWPVLFIPHHQLRHHLIDLFRDQAVVRRIGLRLVTVGHQTPPRELLRNVTRSAAERRDVLLVTRRRRDDPELPVRLDDHRGTRQRRAGNARDEGLFLPLADANDTALAAADPGVADIDVADARIGQTTGADAERDVVVSVVRVFGTVW